jgi:hypothetical protein
MPAVCGQILPCVTRLDPASPSGGTTVPLANRLDSTDAMCINIIRTWAGIFMSKAITPNAPMGTVDFHPNGGLYQKECYDVCKIINRFNCGCLY